MAAGVRQRHRRECSRKGRCKCPWEAFAYSKRDNRKIRQTFATQAQARRWRDDAKLQVRNHALRAPTPTTVREAAQAWLEGARRGVIRNRAGDPYKPSAIRAYDSVLRLRLLPEIGSMRLSAVTRTDLQDLVDGLMALALSPSTVCATMSPLRAIYRRALERPDSGIAINPTAGLRLPKVRGVRDRIAPPEECAKLLGALGRSDRALWATAMYGGLRRGELMALHIEDIDLGNGVIHVRRGWDQCEGEIETKARKVRKVPIAGALRDHLDEHLLSLKWRERSDGLVFGVSPRSPYCDRTLMERARRGWGWRQERRRWVPDESRETLEPVTLHECRHTFASLMIAAGCNAKALSSYMGHATVATTMDLYGHLMPGNESESAALLDSYLERTDTQALSVAQLASSSPQR